MSKILGHRGSIHFPENTLAAFKDVLDAGLDGVEFDVQRTQDGIPVIIHDDTLERTTTGTGRVDSMTLAQLKTLSILEKNGQPSQTLRVSTLEEVMDFLTPYIHKNPELLINIEIKDPRTTPEVVALATRFLQHHHWRYTNLIISSFQHNALRDAKKRSDVIPFGVLYEPEEEGMLDALVNELAPYALHPSLSELQSHGFDKRAWGKKLVLWVHKEKPFPNNMPEIRQALKANPLALITNYPKEVKRELEKSD